MQQLWVVAGKEFRDGLRNRWFLSITLIFAIFSLGLSYFGGVVNGVTGVSNLPSTIASLSSLAVFLIPLIALLLCYDSFVGEKEAGTLLLLLAYPLSKSQLLLGKFIGQGSIIALATLLGFGSSALLLSFYGDWQDVVAAFAWFIVSATLLGWSFAALGYVVSLNVSEKSKAAGIALVLWFVFVLVFDMALLAVLVGVEQGLSSQMLSHIMALNPTDLFRLVNLVSMVDWQSSQSSGVLSVAANGDYSMGQLLLLLLLWVVMPLAAAIVSFKRKTL